MGLTLSSTGTNIAKKDLFEYNALKQREEILIGLAGNPNVGKSTLFNNLTGMHQHTGNWPGKTISSAIGRIKYGEKQYLLADLPGTYSLLTHSKEEDVARDFICFSGAKKIIVVCDATCLERNLNLCLQIIEMTDNVCVCVNLIDEAERKGIEIDFDKLSVELGVEVVSVIARQKKSAKLLSELSELSVSQKKIQIKYPSVIEECIDVLKDSFIKYNFNFSERWLAVNLLTCREEITEKIKTYYNIDLMQDKQVVTALKMTDKIIERYGQTSESIIDKVARTFVKKAEEISGKTVVKKQNKENTVLDKILTGKITGRILMVGLLLVVFWLTIKGANLPSELLSKTFIAGEKYIDIFLDKLNVPEIFKNMLICGVYRVLTWVISVMLPPMAIFFPLFTLLEDSGYLPRIAFNMDNFFRKCNSCGKQALTISMGFGCNAAGVTGTRIIDSDRERLISILTNSFVPCNGRFPMMISVISIFFATSMAISDVISALIMTALICFGIFMTFIVSKILSETWLKGESSSFALELPPFRKPQIGKVIIRSVFDRTLFVLLRAMAVAAPAGLIIWLMVNIKVDSVSLFSLCADFLDPFASFIGLDGVILIAFILGFPANEIVVPLTIMGYTCSGELQQVSDMETLKYIFTSNGWTAVTAICFLVFTLMHWPCSTTCITIYKETKSKKWTFLGFVIPTLCGMILCFLINTVYKILTAV
ncbi:MAG: ferrous iron transport protein B [Clostridia bacterium]|nr:ferrous iron transport protein B [Clostridia bacterium]